MRSSISWTKNMVGGVCEAQKAPVEMLEGW